MIPDFCRRQTPCPCRVKDFKRDFHFFFLSQFRRCRNQQKIRAERMDTCLRMLFKPRFPSVQPEPPGINSKALPRVGRAGLSQGWLLSEMEISPVARGKGILAAIPVPVTELSLSTFQAPLCSQRASDKLLAGLGPALLRIRAGGVWFFNLLCPWGDAAQTQSRGWGWGEHCQGGQG